MKSQFIKSKAGFTLVETLVAISILMISVVGPMVFVANGIKASYYARDQITAFYLAQDAVEALRFIRDNDRIDLVISGTFPAWIQFDSYMTDCSGGNECGIDTVRVYNNDSNQYDRTFADLNLQKDSDGYYGYNNGGTDTKFKRTFTYNKINTDEVEIVVTVTWDSGLVTGRSFTVRENLLYWY